MEMPKRRVISKIKDQVYEVIKENILNEHFKPGQRIQELEIAKQLQVSRSPVRSAINELIGEGLLESIPNKSVRVRKLSQKEIVDTFEFRLIIEKYAVKKVAKIMNGELSGKMAAYRKRFESFRSGGSLKEYVVLDSKFHEFLVSSADNAVILESLQKVAMLIMPFRIISLNSDNRFKESIDEHEKVIDALMEGDGDKAWEVCRTHLILAKEEIVKSLEDMGE